ncbi:hypothetical protein CPJCM30710_01710 [Clostridium polyendosporum]|uniref:Type III secretion system, E component of needle n=1 Tax=Clostridium polyendosporum TaxID=69208 RepID=A0A919RXY7_9CLOT|nr:hypothetical protein [Clostridium polyendosporum]GIM27505.1 hypothetical protein CPJCM30710_01710 [Clostridium polyendosporum]
MNDGKQNVESTINDLRSAKQRLQQALSTVEKEANKKNIQSSLTSVETALSQVQNTISNYVES